jgi:MFS transporter, UMF1 family
VFGLYATTGRAATWLAPALYSLAITVSPATGAAARTSWGILGMLVVLLAGLGLLLPVKAVRPAAGGPVAGISTF